jgi:hypothetical protein
MWLTGIATRGTGCLRGGIIDKVTPHNPETYRGLAEAAWRWVLNQVRWDDGPWIPASVTIPAVTDAPWDRDGMHSGVGGLAHVLAEIRLARPWTVERQAAAPDRRPAAVHITLACDAAETEANAPYRRPVAAGTEGS